MNDLIAYAGIGYVACRRGSSWALGCRTYCGSCPVTSNPEGFAMKWDRVFEQETIDTTGKPKEETVRVKITIHPDSYPAYAAIDALTLEQREAISNAFAPAIDRALAILAQSPHWSNPYADVTRA